MGPSCHKRVSHIVDYAVTARDQRPEPGGLSLPPPGEMLGTKLDSEVPEALGFHLLSPWVFRLFLPVLFVQVRAWQVCQI